MVHLSTFGLHEYVKFMPIFCIRVLILTACFVEHANTVTEKSIFFNKTCLNSDNIFPAISWYINMSISRQKSLKMKYFPIWQYQELQQIVTSYFQIGACDCKKVPQLIAVLHYR